MNYILVDSATGRVQVLLDPRLMALPDRIVRYWVPRIHEGEIYEPLSLWLAGLVSFAVAILAVTGPAIWWWRRRGLN